jgi:hypothetical protein
MKNFSLKKGEGDQSLSLPFKIMSAIGIIG